MTKCPRCNLEQEESSQCAYCGLVFDEFRKSTRASKFVPPERIVLFTIIFVVAAALLTYYLYISDQDKHAEKSATDEHSSDFARETNTSDLKTTAKELSGDVGILDALTGRHTKISVIAMVLFSVIGLGYFAYGKKSRQLLMLICGIALMVYSYFVDGTVYIILIGVGLSAVPFIFGRK